MEWIVPLVAVGAIVGLAIWVVLEIKKVITLSSIFIGLTSLSGAGSIVLIACQIFLWLQKGKWMDGSLLAVWIKFQGKNFYLRPDPLTYWLIDPHEWIGVSKMVRYVMESFPTSLFLFLLAILFLLIGGFVDSKLSRIREGFSDSKTAAARDN